METKPLTMTVADVFQLAGRGTVITGTAGPQAHLLRRNAPIELDSPTHGSIHSSVAELEMFRNCFCPDQPHPIGILLAQPVPSEYLPAGTRVYHSGPIPAA